MIKKIEDLNYYELLEIAPNATTQEIHKAYERVRRVYDPNSIALYSLFSADETAAIYQRVEEAYRTLMYENSRKVYDAILSESNEIPGKATCGATESQSPRVELPLSGPLENPYPAGLEAGLGESKISEPPASTASLLESIAEYSGPAIKMLREHQGMTLRNIADITKVGIRYLELIEEENFAKLPVRAYTRGFLILYAKTLGCDPDKACADYLKRFDAARPAKTK